MSSKLSFTTFADSSLSCGNINSRFVIDINFKRLADSHTTVRVRYHNGEGVRIVVSRNPILSVVVVIDTTTNAFTNLSMFIPCVGKGGVISTVNPCNQVDIVNTSLFKITEVTNILVTSNSDNRITFNKHNIGVNQLRFTTIDAKVNISSILIRQRVIINNINLFIESRASVTFHQSTILIPNIREGRIDFGFTSFLINNISGQIDAFALTNKEGISFICKRSFICSNNLQHLNRKNIDGIFTRNSTTRSSLGNFHHEDCACVNICCIGNRCTIGNCISVRGNLVNFIPLIGEILKIVVAKMSGSSN